MELICGFTDQRDCNLNNNKHFCNYLKRLGSAEPTLRIAVLTDDIPQPLLTVTSVVAGFSMCLLGVWFYLQSIGVYMPGWVPIVALCVCIFADASGLQPLPYVIMTEMFNFQVSVNLDL